PAALFSSSANTLDNSMVVNFSVKLPEPSSDPVHPSAPSDKKYTANKPSPNDYDKNHQQLEQTTLPGDYVLCAPRLKNFKKSYCGCRKNSDCTSIRAKRRFGNGFCDTCGYWPINKTGAYSLKSYYRKKRPRVCPKINCAPLLSTVPKCKNNICILHGPRSINR
nr:hypothetical protein [Deltaproteobacteria bacterium]